MSQICLLVDLYVYKSTDFTVLSVNIHFFTLLIVIGTSEFNLRRSIMCMFSLCVFNFLASCYNALYFVSLGAMCSCVSSFLQFDLHKKY